MSVDVQFLKDTIWKHSHTEIKIIYNFLLLHRVLFLYWQFCSHYQVMTVGSGMVFEVKHPSNISMLSRRGNATSGYSLLLSPLGIHLFPSNETSMKWCKIWIIWSHIITLNLNNILDKGISVLQDGLGHVVQWTLEGLHYHSLSSLQFLQQALSGH